MEGMISLNLGVSDMWIHLCRRINTINSYARNSFGKKKINKYQVYGHKNNTIIKKKIKFNAALTQLCYNNTVNVLFDDGAGKLNKLTCILCKRSVILLVHLNLFSLLL